MLDLLMATAVAAMVACVATRLLIPILQRAAIVDIPGSRSSHDTPTPRGGGIGLMVGLLSGVAVLIASGLIDLRATATVTAIIGLLSAFFVALIDDFRTLPAAPRLIGYGIAVAIGMTSLGPEAQIAQGIVPDWIDTFAMFMIWLWFVNLTNFMDGIDGITGTEMIAIGLGVALIAAVAGLGGPWGGELGAVGLVLAGAMSGFLVWNWPPARVFLGDCGSVALGWLAGYLLIALATAGYWVAALLIPAFYLFDATTTLLRRLVNGEAFWEAHRSHLYQRAFRAVGARRVNTVIAFGNVGLALSALASLHIEVMALVPGLLVLAGMVAILSRWAAVDPARA